MARRLGKAELTGQLLIVTVDATLAADLPMLRGLAGAEELPRTQSGSGAEVHLVTLGAGELRVGAWRRVPRGRHPTRMARTAELIGAAEIVLEAEGARGGGYQ